MKEITSYREWINGLSSLRLLNVQLINHLKKAPDTPETLTMIEQFNTLRAELHEYRLSHTHEFKPPHKRLPPPKRLK